VDIDWVDADDDRHVGESPQVLPMDGSNGGHHFRVYGCVPGVYWVVCLFD